MSELTNFDRFDLRVINLKIRKNEISNRIEELKDDIKKNNNLTEEEKDNLMWKLLEDE